MPIRRLALIALMAATPLSAQDAGSYLAARSAILANDFDRAAEFYTRALMQDPGNLSILESALTSYLGLGEIGRAEPVATRMVEAGQSSQLAALALFAADAREGAWDALLARLDEGQTIGPLMDGLARSWALVGAGRMSEALDAFDEVASGDGVAAFALYHKALALALVGDFESAAELFSGEAGGTLRVTRRGLVAYAQILSQLDRNADALDLLNQSFGSVLPPEVGQLQAALEAGETLPFDTVTSAADGMAEAYFSIANALSGEAQAAYTLIYARMALALRPDHFDALLLTADILDELERWDLATEVLDGVSPDHPSFHSAEILRAEALRKSGRTEAAIEALRQLTKTHAEVPTVHVQLGDTLRGLERYAEATAAYDAAIELIAPGEEQHWVIFFARGITHERGDRWPEAEADFRRALELRPEQPQVLNYLGYSFLEMRENMDEAIDMIERAVALRPDSGYIVDSLGWGLYLKGDYAEALVHLERAAALMPVDPIVNDHLGDAYWANGRAREAEFQWHRALSFEPEEEDAERIRRKLEVGLDAVLEEEGLPPLRVADDAGE